MISQSNQSFLFFLLFLSVPPLDFPSSYPNPLHLFLPQKNTGLPAIAYEVTVRLDIPSLIKIGQGNQVTEKVSKIKQQCQKHCYNSNKKIKLHNCRICVEGLGQQGLCMVVQSVSPYEYRLVDSVYFLVVCLTSMAAIILPFLPLLNRIPQSLSND